MQNALVRYSRAGDAFHYRWAARRCLRMIDPTSGLRSVTIEASKDQQAPGEYAIDLAEYFEEPNGAERVAYFQLKHSTVRLRTVFTFSELKETFASFSKRFRAEEIRPSKKGRRRAASFSIVTNREISNSLKDVIFQIASGGKAPAHLRTALEEATTLSGSRLRRFCSVLSLTDGEGDYIVQRRKLQGEIAEYVAGFIDSEDTDKIIALVADRALPETESGTRNGEITPEDLLRRLGVTSPRDLFPALPAFEPLAKPIKRQQHDAILQHVLAQSTPAIIHAEGGVGKSVVAQLIAASLPKGCHAVLYDCFGAGKYRSPSEPRHHARHALVQIANELASRGLCRPLVPRLNVTQEGYFRAFIERLREATKQLRSINPSALLVLLIDAADSAEMAAAEFGDPCFASALLRDSLPPNCRLAMFCRTEHVDLLKPAENVRRLQLWPFSEQESRVHLRSRFVHASDHDGREFHRLSGANPRVQANALAAGHATVGATLGSLGPEVTTVNAQISEQLRVAVAKVKDQHAPNFGQQVDALCHGLANLPPLIPIPVLARAAGVNIATVKSFVSDLGRPLWHSDDAVQFRDEPTETWFRQQFAANASQIGSYVSVLEPLAAQYTYVAKALPQLLLRSGDHTGLISLALSDTHLPVNNPIEERDVRVYRLQFAFKAALKRGRLADAARLAFRAGEEVAGDRRQTELLGKNADLIVLFQEKHRIQELAYRQILGGGWEGCENIYSAALLSSVTDFKGEARAYLRAAHRWLDIYFKERRKNKERRSSHNEPLADAHILELAWAHYNLSGAKELVGHVAGWRPDEVVFRVMRMFSRRLIDAGRFSEVDALARAGAKMPYLILAIADELSAVARLPQGDCLRATLNALANPRTRPRQPQWVQVEESFNAAIVSFLEACTARGLPMKLIARALNHYTDRTASRILTSDYQEAGRGLFLRGVCLRAVLRQQRQPDPDSLMPNPKKDESTGLTDSERTNLRQMLGALLPWHFLRTQLLVRSSRGRRADLDSAKTSSKSAVASRYRSFDRIPFEVSALHFEVLAWKGNATASELDDFIRKVLTCPDPTFWLGDRLRAARIAFRSGHLVNLRDPLEQSCSQELQQPGTEGPEDRADGYARLGRAVLPQKSADASAYFAAAVDAVSKFGDEMVERWEAVVAMAKRSAAALPPATQSLVYRFVRCGEMIGESVAREKYWDRDDVFRVAANLHQPAACAALSRWRDRDVGSFDRQLEALATVLVEDRKVSPLAGWCLSGFLGCNGSSEFAALCLRHETDPDARSELLERAIRDLELADADRADWERLRLVAHELGLATDRLDNLAVTAPKRDYGSTPLINDSSGAKLLQKHERRARSLLKRVDLLRPEELRRAISKFENSKAPREPKIFWRELLKRVPTGRESEFCNILVQEESLSYFDMGYALAYIRSAWLQKAAVNRVWRQVTFAIGRRYATELSNSYRIDHWRHMGLKEDDILLIRRGVVEGLSDSLELVDASTFFGFIINVANELTPEEARGLLDYSVERFEKHMDPESGDGPWADWLVVDDDMPKALTGLLWSALASPYADTRWQAAHCVRRLGELGCDPEIDALLDWMKRGSVGSFGSQQFPFYALHAKLYCLIALGRVAIAQPAKLARWGRLFADIALSGMAHLLIQKHAAEISLAIEGACPGTFSLDMKAQLQQVRLSAIPMREVDDKFVEHDTPWHAEGTVDTTVQYPFGMDFGDHWLRPLGVVFGVSQKQVEALVREVVVKELGARSSDDYEPDPRQSQWRSPIRENYYYKDSYPRADDYRFYVSYHAMLSVAVRLHANMPVLRRDHDWVDDRWGNWLEQHILARSDGRWLSDRRDPMPGIRREWTRGTGEGHCLWAIDPDDFFDVLRRQTTLPDALNVAGSWSDCVGDRVETVRISSALVDPQTAESLATSLRSALHDYGLPSYKTREEDFGPPPFNLTGWIQWPDRDDSGLDRFDPYAKSISYPPLEIGESFALLLGVTSDVERREWRTLTDGKLLARCDIWSNRREERHERESPYRSGRRITASIGLLRQLCAAEERDLIISVAIDRHLERSFGSRGADLGYMSPSHQIFLFSANGQLRDAKKSY